MGLDPTDVLRRLPEDEFEIMTPGATSKRVGNRTTTGVRRSSRMISRNRP
jgi:hypothetical protein